MSFSELAISEIEAWKWTATLHHEDGFCAGSLIEKNLVITTGTCCSQLIDRVNYFRKHLKVTWIITWTDYIHKQIVNLLPDSESWALFGTTLFNSTAPENKRNISNGNIRIHPDFTVSKTNGFPRDNVCLIKFDNPFYHNRVVQPISIEKRQK